jgi:hypothetical protein
MPIKILVLVLSALLLTGCSSTASEYDELHVIQYEKCIDYAVEAKLQVFGPQRFTSEEIIGDAIKSCEGWKPLKK